MGGMAQNPLGVLHSDFIDEKGNNYKKLTGTFPNPLLYDITHDNKSALQNWNSRAILPIFALVNTSNL